MPSPELRDHLLHHFQAFLWCHRECTLLHPVSQASVLTINDVSIATASSFIQTSIVKSSVLPGILQTRSSMSIRFSLDQPPPLEVQPDWDDSDGHDSFTHHLRLSEASLRSSLTALGDLSGSWRRHSVTTPLISTHSGRPIFESEISSDYLSIEIEQKRVFDERKNNSALQNHIQLPIDVKQLCNADLEDDYKKQNECLLGMDCGSVIDIVQQHDVETDRRRVVSN